MYSSLINKEIYTLQLAVNFFTLICTDPSNRDVRSTQWFSSFRHHGSLDKRPRLLWTTSISTLLFRDAERPLTSVWMQTVICHHPPDFRFNTTCHWLKSEPGCSYSILSVLNISHQHPNTPTPDQEFAACLLKPTKQVVQLPRRFST
jgi:hypothetical protein